MSRLLKITLLVSAATLLLCILAFYNGFPLIYPDTGTYVRSGFTGELPIDRPVFYGIFIRHISLAESLWLVILAQTAILAWLIYLTVRRFVQEARIGYYYIGIMFVLTFTTAISYFTNLLIPDVFTPILFLSAFHLAFFKELTWPQRIPVLAFFSFSIITHLSNFPTLFLTLLMCAVIGWLRRKKNPAPFSRQSLILLGAMTVATFLFVPTFNATQDGEFRFTKGGSVFMTNRLRDLDIVKDFLYADCAEGEGKWKLCPYKDNLYGDFLWDYANSPLYKIGGWDANFDEFKRMNRQIFKRPRFLARFLRASLEEGIRQYFTFQAGPAFAYPEESAPVSNLKIYFPKTLRAILASRQIHGAMDFKDLNRRQEWVVIGSMCFLLLLAIDRKRFRLLPLDFRWFLLALLVFSVANSVSCASLAIIDSRYMGRIAWLFPFAAMLILVMVAEKYDLPGRAKQWIMKN